MDLLYIDLTCKIPVNCISNASLPYIALTSVLMAPLRVIGLNYQLSSSISYTSTNESIKYLRAWNSKSYNFKGVKGSYNVIKFPVYKNYKELFAKSANRKMKAYYSATILESLYWWISFQYKVGAVSLMGNFLSENPYANISILAGFFSVLDAWARPIEIAITRLTYFRFNMGEFVERMSFWYIAQVYKQHKYMIENRFVDSGLLGPPSVGGVLVCSKFVCWFYALKAYEKGWNIEKSIDMMLIHTLLYPAITAQIRVDVQDTMSPYRYRNVIHALIKIYYTEGVIDGLYRGFICNTLYALPKYYLIPTLLYTFSNAKYTKYLDKQKDSGF
ncbi:unnamed protein product [Blepharisma stoltei]|uniref:Uncharacterized protein n=1 Tax=Blepharisma stoltei TaxID=1481888 RepID=A0AAU9J023_9CILI|nr:unnamed protein product [Blepharisma stoltei]